MKKDLALHFHQLTSAHDQRLIIMYGQTEATARISYVPPQMLQSKIGSIGIAIPAGSLALDTTEGMNELVYRGPNVMMGYAENALSLSRGDDLKGLLKTGDIGSTDEDGYFYVVGRIKRITKLFGQRVNLQDVEREAEIFVGCPVAAVEREEGIVLFVQHSDHYSLNEEGLIISRLQKFISRYLGVPPKVIAVRTISDLPILTSGKRDYQTLTLSLS